MNNRQSAFTFAADLSAWREQLEGRLDQVVVQTGLRIAEAVSVGNEWNPTGTPVDTGFARSSWVAAINGTPPAGPPRPPAGDHGPFPESYGDMAAVIAGAKVGDVITITNNCEYILTLEYGHSGKAPEGMVRITLAQGQPIVNQVAAEVLEAAR